MTFTSYQRLPTLMTYAEALHKLNNTAPIRGRSPALIPLGARKDCDKFKIEMADDGESIDIYLYRYRVLRYLKPLPDQPDHITRVQLIRETTWGSPEGWVLWSVLNHVMPHVSIARGHVQVTFRDGSKFLTAVPKAHQPVTLRIDTGAYYPMASCPIEREEKIEQHQWVINRKAANNVRAKYGRFYRYVKGMVALRREQITDSYTDTEMLCVPRSENENALGQSIAGLAWSNRLDNKYPDNDPRMPRFESGTWRERMDKFLLLISDHEDESVQTDNFATAFAAVLALCSARKYWMRNRSDGSVLIEASQIPKKVDELIFKYHTEVFEKVPVPEGRIPSTKYDTWV